ncbi:MxaK protein [Methylobacterium radiodurans]|uniref:MxaK protein n=1 Tax=Methylobacterium radiodurans TaxID=2202828 RepID=A0A2U8W157_9HYPH|nr:MxaK protein [Methylobacterium radiodurans]AWN39240.1 MxaK protein [Methylobacterium radiodurans]
MPNLYGAWTRTRPRLLLALPPLLLAGAIVCAGLSWRTESANREIAALEAGRDRPVAADAPAPILLARVLQLARRDATEEMEPLVAALESRDAPALLARARYALGNARLRRALNLIERGQLDPAGPLIVLARQEYRRALQARPEFWDAKFNLDVASRLIRDFPEIDRQVGDELKAEPKKIWTDIPGQPRGAP